MLVTEGTPVPEDFPFSSPVSLVRVLTVKEGVKKRGRRERRVPARKIENGDG